MAEIDLEQELQLELAKLDQIFFSTQDSQEDGDTNRDSNARPNRSVSYDFASPQPRFNYELAEAEIEKEELQDQLRMLLSKTENFDAQLLQLHAENQDLFTRYTLIMRENERLKQEAFELKQQQQQTIKRSDNLPSPPSTPTLPPPAIVTVSEQEYHALEFKLAEARAKLARYQQNLEDLSLAKEVTVKELEKERLLRIKAEKERDAYSAAYEMSLKKIDHWAQTKALAKRVLGGTATTTTNNNNTSSSNNGHGPGAVEDKLKIKRDNQTA